MYHCRVRLSVAVEHRGIKNLACKPVYNILTSIRRYATTVSNQCAYVYDELPAAVPIIKLPVLDLQSVSGD